MDEKSWEILKVIHEEHNITRAARRLYITQPALTYRIQQIEDKFGVKIYLKNKNGLKFTPEGEYLVKFAKRMLTMFENAKEQLANMSNEIKGVLKIGVSASFAQYKLPKILKEFFQYYPKSQVQVNAAWSSDVVQLLRRKEIHLGIVKGDINWTEQKQLLCEEDICIISKKQIDMGMLPKYPRIDYKTDPLLTQLISNWWRDRFVDPPSNIMVVDNSETCKEMVNQGLGYAILPEMVVKNDDNKLYTTNIRSKNGSNLTRGTWLVYHSEILELRIARTFIDFLHEKMKSEIT